MDAPRDVVPEPLPGGRSTDGVVRIGGHVHRPMSKNAPFVHTLLLHLEAVGFAAAPRFRGVDGEGREVLTFVEGAIPHGAQPGGWTDAQLRDAAKLLRAYHDATAGSVLAGPEEVVCHNDVAPWNVVLIGHRPVGLIDFDGALPGPRIRDLSYAIWCWLALGAADVDTAEQARRIRLMRDAYGPVSQTGLISEIAERQREILGRHLRRGWIDQARRVAADIAWLDANRSDLLRRGCAD